MGVVPKVEANARETAELLQQVTALKTEYCQTLDAKQWDRWGSLFTEDRWVPTRSRQYAGAPRSESC